MSCACKKPAFVHVILPLLICVLLLYSTMAENSAEQQVLQGNSQFTLDLYKILANNNENLIFSPISIHAVLSMAYQGAQGTTLKFFANALKISEPKVAGEGYHEIMKRLNNIENVTLLMANKIYVKEGCSLLPDFGKAISEKFLSETEFLDFIKNEAAANAINTWVEKKTCDKIKDLIQATDLNVFTRLVLVNAVYFKGNWKHQFNKTDTRIEPFYLNDVDKIDVEMMHINKKFRYQFDEELGAEILEMPYVNENLSMVIILPNERNGIANLEKKLITTNLMEVTRDLRENVVNVALPKFKIEQTIDLENALTELGLAEIFSKEHANFRGMIELDPNENLYVSKAVQKVFIEVNEEGAEAAAATGCVVRMKRSIQLTKEFYVNHPFICLIIEKSAKGSTILFSGKIGNILYSESKSTHDEL